MVYFSPAPAGSPTDLDGAPPIDDSDLAGSKPPASGDKPSPSTPISKTTLKPEAKPSVGAGGGTAKPKPESSGGSGATGGSTAVEHDEHDGHDEGEHHGVEHKGDSPVDPKSSAVDLGAVEDGHGHGTEGEEKPKRRRRKKKKKPAAPPRRPIDPKVFSTFYQVAPAHIEYQNALTVERTVSKKKVPGLTANEASIYLNLKPPPDLKDPKYASLGAKEGAVLHSQDKREYLDEIADKSAEELRQEISNMQVARLLEKYKKDGVEPKVAFDRLKARGYFPDDDGLGWSDWPSFPIKAHHYKAKSGEKVTLAPKASLGLDAESVQTHLEDLKKGKVKFDKAEDAEAMRQTMARESLVRVVKDRWTNPKGSFQYTEEEANGILENLGLLEKQDGAYEVTEFDPQRWTNELLAGDPKFDVLVDYSKSDSDDLRYMVEDRPDVKALKFFYEGEEIRPDAELPEIPTTELNTLSPVALAIMDYAKTKQAEPRGAASGAGVSPGGSPSASRSAGSVQGLETGEASHAVGAPVSIPGSRVAGASASDDRPRTVLELMQEGVARRQQRREDRRRLNLGDTNEGSRAGGRLRDLGNVAISRVGRLANRGLSRDFYDPQVFEDAERVARPRIDEIFRRFDMHPEDFQGGVSNPNWALQGASYQPEASDSQQQQLLAREHAALVASGKMNAEEATGWQRSQAQRSAEEIDFNLQALTTDGEDRAELLKQQSAARQSALAAEEKRMKEMGFTDQGIAEYQRQNRGRNIEDIKKSFPVKEIPSGKYTEVVESTRDEMRAQIISDAAEVLQKSGVQSPEAVATNLYSQYVELGSMAAGAPVDELVEHRVQVEEDLRHLQDDPELQDNRAVQLQKEAAATKTDAYLDKMEAKVESDASLKSFYTPENMMLFAHQNGVQLDDPASWDRLMEDLDSGALDKKVNDFPHEAAAKDNSQARQRFQLARFQVQDMPDFSLVDSKERNKELFTWQKEQQGNRINEKNALRTRKWNLEDKARDDKKQKFQTYQGALQQNIQPLVQNEMQKRGQDHSIGMNNMFNSIQSKNAEIDKLTASQIQIANDRLSAILQAMQQVQQTILQGLFGNNRAV